MARRIIVLGVSTAVVVAAVTLSISSFAGANPQTNNRALAGGNVHSGRTWQLGRQRTWRNFDSTSESTPTRTQTTIEFAVDTVVSGKMAYSSGVCPGGNTTFSGFSIEYTPAP